MKRTKRIISLALTFALIFSTLGMIEINASTTDTRYSVKHIQNGGFEENTEDYTFKSNYTQPNKTVVPYWDTTAYEGKFEFFKSTSAHFNVTKKKYPSNPEYLNVAEGEIAAELNADEESSIYQRINTVSGSTYTWGLDHRGRDRTDRMVLIIGPEQSVDPSKPSKKGQDQFIRITNWLKTQYGVEYPEVGCSKKYTVFSRPFAASGKFVDESADEDKNISLYETEEINQEWSVWVISSPYCNTSTENTVNGWSKYGTNVTDNFDDIMKGANSSLGYDCTYTVPKGQTNTLFAFCSYSSGRETVDDITYGNLIDGINFDLYQPMSASSTAGGIGGVDAENADLSKVTIKSDITSGDSLNSVVLDGQYCTVYTAVYNEDNLKDCTFAGAYVTINNDDGTSVTKFVEPYKGDISQLTEEEIDELSKSYFIEKTISDSSGESREWQYYYKFLVTSPVSISLIYTKAPFVLYDSNGGQEYYFSPDNTVGGNLVGFADHFQKVFDKEIEGEATYVDTSAYYSNYETIVQEDGSEKTIPGKYISHAALPNENWDTNEDGTSPHKFCGWSVIGGDGKQVVLDGVHTIQYNPNEGDGGMVSFSDSDNTIDDLLLDASHGITLTALWKFVHRAQAQTYNDDTGVFENSAVGGTVEETLIEDDLRDSDIKEYIQSVNGEDRVECVDAAGNTGDKIMFKAKPDYNNQYMFVGWYYREKQEDGTYQEVLRSTSSSIAVTIEEGKLNTYYARFQKITAPVVFHYTPTGNPNDYSYYEASTDNKYGKYYQEVAVGRKAEKPSGDEKSVKTWYTSPTERGAEYVFDFENDRIYDVTELYAGPSFGFNYYNYFKFEEPWFFKTYSTLKFDGKYIDLKNDADISDYNVYILKGTLGESAPSASAIKSNKNTIKVGKSVNDTKLIYNTLTNAGQSFNRIGTVYGNFYLFNMKTPVWVVFDYTYKGIKYTSTVKNRCLYNNITTYMAEAENGLFTTYPPETEADLRNAQNTLLYSIQAMYDAVSTLGITEPTEYYDAVDVDGLTYNQATDGVYQFTSATAIRNIEPWGFKYSFTVEDNTVTDFSDYGAVVLTDKASTLNEGDISVEDLLNNEESVMYSKSKGNVYLGDDNAVEVYYTNNILALDFDKNTYVVFFVKDGDGNFYYSNVYSNSYNSIASADTGENADISKSIADYSTALINYISLIKENDVNE
ncbi:MAG: hypothetical protein ACI4IG_00255 [Eubacterium sp.]